MRKLLGQLTMRLIMGALIFLLGLTGAIVLVVRDSLLFSARNMADVGAQALLDQRHADLLESAQREAELSDHAVHHNPSDLAPLNQRLNALSLMPGSYAFIMDKQGKILASSEKKSVNSSSAAMLPTVPESQEVSVLGTTNFELYETFEQMQAGKSDVIQTEIDAEPVLIAYAPLKETGWSLAIVEPVSSITARAKPFSNEIQNVVNSILQATLMTIGYFAVVAIIGAIIAARALTRPIRTLVEGTRSIAAGDLSVRLPVKSSDELAFVAISFNHMAEELSSRNNELLRANVSLSEREARLRLITEVTTDALYEWDITEGTTQWSHSYRTLFGYPAEGHHEHRWWRERVHPDDLEPAVARLESAFQNREEFLLFEYRYRRVDDSYAYVVDRGFIFYSEEGHPVRMVGAMIDITDRVALSEAQTRAALEERQRLARELHDSVTQSLYSLTLLAEASRRTALNGNIEMIIENIARLGETAQQALKEMRLLVYELRPLALETAGLADALQHRLDAVERRAGIETKLVLDLQLDLPAEIESGLYRIALEILNNSLKHAEATAVSVLLQGNSQQVELEVIDNGKGFETDANQSQGGLGLVSIRERAATLNGQVTITSKPGEGARVWVSVPLSGQL